MKLTILYWLCRLHGITHFDRDYVDWLEYRFRLQPGQLLIELRGRSR